MLEGRDHTGEAPAPGEGGQAPENPSATGGRGPHRESSPHFIDAEGEAQADKMPEANVTLRVHHDL